MKLKLNTPEHQIILAHILQKSREYVLAHPEIRLNKAQKRRFDSMVKRRLNHEPMAYILGHKEFYGLDFKVNKHTLIPRPETELLVELATRNVERGAWSEKNPLLIIDVGTGSGNIIISIAKSCTKYHVLSIKYLGIDISPNALSIAKLNAKTHNVDKKIKFIKSDLLDFLIHDTKYKIQNTILIANLPYLSKEIYSSSMPDVKNFEPKSALVSGQDGLDHYEKLFKEIMLLKNKCSMFHAICYMEISPEQKPKITRLIKLYFPQAKPEFHKDLAGKWRVADISL